MWVTRPVNKHIGEHVLGLKRFGILKSTRTGNPTNTGCLVLKNTPRSEMFIDVAECPHSSGVVTGQNTSGTINLNRRLYLRSKMDDIVAKLSGGAIAARTTYLQREKYCRILNPIVSKCMFTFERLFASRASV